MTQKFDRYGRLFDTGAAVAAVGAVVGMLFLLPLSAPPASAAAVESNAIAGTSSLSQYMLVAQAKKKDDDLLTKDDDDDDDDDKSLLKAGDDDDKEKSSEDASSDALSEAGKQHAALFAENRYPSATTCGTCHPRHFEEWAISQHSYAQLSPAYMALQNFINSKVNGTNGDFCIRCHNQVGMNMEEPVGVSNLERHPTSREGIT